MDDGGAQGNAGIHGLPIGGKVPHAAAVGAAPVGFELINGFHGADFGGAGDCARGKTGQKGIHNIHFGTQRALNGGNDVHDVGIPLDAEGVFDLNAARDAHTADVVAAQIQQHQMFRDFFGISHQARGQRLILFLGFAPWPRASDGANGHLAFGDFDEGFGTGSHQHQILHIQKKQIGGRVQTAQSAIIGKGIPIKGAGKPLG